MGPIVPWCNPSHPYYSSTPVFLSMRFTTVSIATLGDASLVQLTGSGPDRGAMAHSGPIGPKRCNRAPTVQSGPDLGPVNLANRSHATFVELSVKLCCNLSSGLPHSFCRTWWQPCGMFLEPYLIALAASWNSWNPKPTKQQCQAFTLLHRESRSDVI